MQPDYVRNYLLMNAHGKVAFCFLLNIVNIDAHDDVHKTTSEWFLTWDILEDAMPFLTSTIELDIQWRANDLKQKVQELDLVKQQVVILINPSHLNAIPQDSALLGFPSRVSSLLDPTHVIMDPTLLNVQKVGNGFLHGCSSLKGVNLSPLSIVREIGGGFLKKCSGLQEIDLSPLSNVQKVGPCFLSGCSSLEEVDLSPLSKIQVAGDCFLYGCCSLKKVHFGPLSNLQQVGLGFFSGCSSLKEVNLSALSNLQEVGSYFFSGCLSLTRVILPTSPPTCLRHAVCNLPYIVDDPHSSSIHPASKNGLGSTSGTCALQ